MAANIESTPKSVQEIAVNGQDPPEKYFYKGSDIDSPVPLINVSVIDLSLLTSPSTRPDQLLKLRSALTSWGCFQVINHGKTDSFLDQVREAARTFFELPTEEKKKYSRENDSIEGYGNDTVVSENQTLDWTDRLYLTFTPLHQRRLKFWPLNPPAFRETLEEYLVKSKEINEIILKAMASSLNIDEKLFLEQYGEAEEANMIARFNYYPPCPNPNRILGVKPHADASAITILLQDKQVEGLQFLKDNHWFKVPIIPQALLINAGDQVEIMSNGILKSPVHRVVTNSEKDRITLAVFCIPGSDREIKPVNALIDESRPRLYKNVKDYVSIYFQYYQLGKRPIEAAKI